MSRKTKSNKKYVLPIKEEEVEIPPPPPPPEHPPTTYAEFLAVNKLNEWPIRLTSETEFDIDVDYFGEAWSLNGIREQLTNSADFGMNIFDDLHSRVDEFSEKVTLFSSYLTSAESRSNESLQSLFHAPREDQLPKAEDLDAVKLHPSFSQKIKDPKETLQEEVKALKTRNVDYVSFPGFRAKELTELPSQLEAPQLLNKVTEAQHFNKGLYVLWKKLFLSEASVSILQDTFWWFFLETFEHNPIAQDKLFTRVADSYIALFLSVHQDIRDKFFQEYPRCLAQCVYLTFYEAFPESISRFSEEFVSELSGLTSEWISGVRPPIADWKKWPWDKLCPVPEGGQSNTLPDNDRTAIRRSAITANDLHFSLEFPLGKQDQTSAETPASMRETPTAVSFDDNLAYSTIAGEKRSLNKSRKATRSAHHAVKRTTSAEKSAFAGPGPDMERVLFNISGRSPLVAHHLYMKNLRDKYPAVGKSVKRTEVIHEQSPGPTYQDIINQSKKTMKNLQTQRIKSEASTRDHIKKLRHFHKKASQKMKLVDPTKDPMEIKRISDQVLDDAVSIQSRRRIP